mmetsp:Transcript_94215/g.266502  ORF Transcript_94215/g.266502 Transcript_94215/m.266502 type:complete len:214 (-) Transcript_94215:262-903(-)
MPSCCLWSSTRRRSQDCSSSAHRRTVSWASLVSLWRCASSSTPRSRQRPHRLSLVCSTTDPRTSRPALPSSSKECNSAMLAKDSCCEASWLRASSLVLSAASVSEVLRSDAPCSSLAPPSWLTSVGCISRTWQACKSAPSLAFSARARLSCSCSTCRWSISICSTRHCSSSCVESGVGAPWVVEDPSPSGTVCDGDAIKPCSSARFLSTWLSR